jgi:hypothetical protein
MESMFWSFRTLDTFQLTVPILLNLLACFAFFQSDRILLLFRSFLNVAFDRPDAFRPLGRGCRPSGLVIIPSLLRDAEELNAITTTVESCASNGYPGDLVIIASVDGITEHPVLVDKLRAWVRAQSFPDHIHIHVAGTPTRLGKMMAVEAGVSFMKQLVASGAHARMPALYFSIDGDGTLGPHALELLAARLTTPHPITGNPRRVVSGKICIRPDLLWSGWRNFFTVKGQIYIQVAREFLVSNVARYNWKVTPKIGIPGALYCTWTDLLVKAPHFMGFMQTLRFVDWLKWWVGFAPPKFSESKAPPLPEALTGASDDTCICFIASLASWKDGKLDFDAARTPLHAFGRFFFQYFFERSHDYEPEARVFTFTPSTLKSLFVQRVRWNSSRVECAGRFWRAFWYHWEIGLPVSGHLALLLNTVFNVGFYYVVLPYYVLGSSRAALGFVLGYAAQTIAYSLYTVMSLALERDYRRYWRVLLCLPLASLHSILINCAGCVVGVTKDVFLLGNSTKFAPEWTLMKGRCERIALLFRARRFVAVSLRSALRGDVPLGTFWFGWTETPWTPSGFEGWTTGNKPRSIVWGPALGLFPTNDVTGERAVARVTAPVGRAPVPQLATGATALADASATEAAPSSHSPRSGRLVSIRADEDAPVSAPAPSKRAA